MSDSGVAAAPAEGASVRGWLRASPPFDLKFSRRVPPTPARFAASVLYGSDIEFIRYFLGGHGAMVLRLVIFLAGLLLIHSAALAEKRIAPRIVNETYASEIGRLANPPCDVTRSNSRSSASVSGL
jgi:hypothetical protein